MFTVSATQLKNRLGPVLARAALEPVAIVRHGRIVAYLTPAPPQPPSSLHAAGKAPASRVSRADEERLARLCASGDFRPSRWRRAGDPWLLAGLAVMLASTAGQPRMRLLALAERLSPGMSRSAEFSRWLARSPIRPARFLPMVAAERRAPRR